VETGVTRLLEAWREGDDSALDDLVPLVYDELRALARLKMSDEAAGHTLRSTELVHEAWIKLSGASVDWQDRAHFFAIAGRAMRQILVEHARRRRSRKRGGGEAPATLDAERVADHRLNDDLVIELDQAMSRLAAPRMRPTDVADPDYYHRVVDCQWACPAHTNVPGYIRLIAQGRYTEAYLLNRESNVFPGILGRTCDRPCEPACRRTRSTASRSRSAG
jgi:RNA polymerase sigma factor (TIGR02999 family)